MSWIRFSTGILAEQIINTRTVDNIYNNGHIVAARRRSDYGPDETVILWAGPVFKRADGKVDISSTQGFSHSVLVKLCSRIDQEPVVDIEAIAEEVARDFAAERPSTREWLIEEGWLDEEETGTEGTDSSSSSSTSSSTGTEAVEK